MLNRRHIRLKIMQLIYALKISDFDYDNDVNKQLFKSLEDIYDLYLILISLLIEVQLKAESYLKISQKKHLVRRVMNTFICRIAKRLEALVEYFLNIMILKI